MITELGVMSCCSLLTSALLGLCRIFVFTFNLPPLNVQSAAFRIPVRLCLYVRPRSYIKKTDFILCQISMLVAYRRDWVFLVALRYVTCFRFVGDVMFSKCSMERCACSRRAASVHAACLVALVCESASKLLFPTFVSPPQS